MTEQYPYAKATLVFEQFDGNTQTFDIPRAREIQINEWMEPDDTELGKPWLYVNNTLNLGISLKADFDTESGFCYRKYLTETKPKKLEIDRWQYEELIGVLSCGGRENFEETWAHMREHYEIRKLEQRGKDVPNVYIFYGYKQDATRWGLENDVSRKDILCASEWARVQGRRARPVMVAQDSEWSKLNWNHEFSRQMRQQVSVLESYYGSADG